MTVRKPTPYAASMTAGRRAIGRPVGRDPAGRQHDHPIGEPRGQPKIMQAHHHAGAARGLGAQHRHGVQRIGRIEAGHRLVGQQDLGLGGERAGQQQAGALALRQGIDRAVGEGQPVDAPQRPLDGVGIRRRERPAEVGAVRQAAQGHEIAAEQRPVDRRTLREIRDAPCANARSKLAKRCAVELDVAAGGAVEAGEMAQQGGLARSVRADDRRHLIGGEGDVDGLENGARASPADQGAGGEPAHAASQADRARRTT